MLKYIISLIFVVTIYNSFTVGDYCIHPCDPCRIKYVNCLSLKMTQNYNCECVTEFNNCENGTSFCDSPNDQFLIDRTCKLHKCDTCKPVHQEESYKLRRISDGLAFTLIIIFGFCVVVTFF